MTYKEYYWTQSRQKRFRLNEITIWAVNKLLYDINKATWRIASTRFRKAVDRWTINNATKE